VIISNSDLVKHGLEDMLDAASDGMRGIIEDSIYTDIATALLVIEIAKRAEDQDDWFPCGKWATIQAIQGRCTEQLDTLFIKPTAPTEQQQGREELLQEIMDVLRQPEISEGYAYSHACSVIFDLIEDFLLKAKAPVGQSFPHLIIEHSGDCSFWMVSCDVCDCGAFRQAASLGTMDEERWAKHLAAVDRAKAPTEQGKKKEVRG